MKNAINTINLKHLYSLEKTEGKAEDKENIEKYTNMLNFVDRLEQDE